MVDSTPLGPDCGPHCGTDERGTHHCRSCHDAHQEDAGELGAYTDAADVERDWESEHQALAESITWIGSETDD